MGAGDLVEGTSTGISQSHTHGAAEKESAGVADLCMYACVHTLPVIIKSFYRIKSLLPIEGMSPRAALTCSLRKGHWAGSTRVVPEATAAYLGQRFVSVCAAEGYLGLHCSVCAVEGKRISLRWATQGYTSVVCMCSAVKS